MENFLFNSFKPLENILWTSSVFSKFDILDLIILIFLKTHLDPKKKKNLILVESRISSKVFIGRENCLLAARNFNGNLSTSFLRRFYLSFNFFFLSFFLFLFFPPLKCFPHRYTSRAHRPSRARVWLSDAAGRSYRFDRVTILTRYDQSRERGTGVGYIIAKMTPVTACGSQLSLIVAPPDVIYPDISLRDTTGLPGILILRPRATIDTVAFRVNTYAWNTWKRCSIISLVWKQNSPIRINWKFSIRVIRIRIWYFFHDTFRLFYYSMSGRGKEGRERICIGGVGFVLHVRFVE